MNDDADVALLYLFTVVFSHLLVSMVIKALQYAVANGERYFSILHAWSLPETVDPAFTRHRVEPAAFDRIQCIREDTLFDRSSWTTSCSSLELPSVTGVFRGTFTFFF